MSMTSTNLLQVPAARRACKNGGKEDWFPSPRHLYLRPSSPRPCWGYRGWVCQVWWNMLYVNHPNIKTDWWISFQGQDPPWPCRPGSEVHNASFPVGRTEVMSLLKSEAPFFRCASIFRLYLCKCHLVSGNGSPSTRLQLQPQAWRLQLLGALQNSVERRVTMMRSH